MIAIHVSSYIVPSVVAGIFIVLATARYIVFKILRRWTVKTLTNLDNVVVASFRVLSWCNSTPS